MCSARSWPAGYPCASVGVIPSTRRRLRTRTWKADVRPASCFCFPDHEFCVDDRSGQLPAEEVDELVGHGQLSYEFLAAFGGLVKQLGQASLRVDGPALIAVSYTHLTLPTI